MQTKTLGQNKSKQWYFKWISKTFKYLEQIYSTTCAPFHSIKLSFLMQLHDSILPNTLHLFSWWAGLGGFYSFLENWCYSHLDHFVKIKISDNLNVHGQASTVGGVRHISQAVPLSVKSQRHIQSSDVLMEDDSIAIDQFQMLFINCYL